MELTPSQVEAVESSARCLQVVACAGSGKTEVLARRVLRFLREGVEPSGIVALTFTEKAAEELKARIDQRAEEAGLSVRGLPPSSAGLFAGTIHSYCLRLLQSSGECELYDVGVQVLPNVVNILTVHQSKGLEFPVVFVPCLVEGRFPSSRTGRKRKWYLPESMTWSSSPEPDRLDTKDPGQDETRECAGQTGGARNSGGSAFRRGTGRWVPEATGTGY